MEKNKNKMGEYGWADVLIILLSLGLLVLLIFLDVKKEGD